MTMRLSFRHWALDHVSLKIPVQGEKSKVIWFYQLSWYCKLATVPKLTFRAFIISSDEGLRSKLQLWNSSRWPIDVINSVNDIQLTFDTLPPTQHHVQFLQILNPFIHMARKILFTNKTTLLEHFVCLSKLSISIDFDYPGTNSFPKQRRRHIKKIWKSWMNARGDYNC